MSDKISEYLAEQKRLAEAATPGPWRGEWFEVLHRDTGNGDEGEIAKTQWLGDAKFIATSRESVPRLVAALEAVREIIAPDVEWRMRRLSPMGWPRECDCASCRVWSAIESALADEADGAEL